MNKRNVKIIPPERLGDLKYSAPKEKAAGIPALTSSIKHISEEMGVLKGISLLSKMNQKEGFDCPGCAWPDPDEKRSTLGEYCENGVKALAEEATVKRVDPAFFARHSVEELSDWTDYELGKSGRITHPMYLREGSSHYEPISWKDAFSLVGKKLRSLDSPDEAVFYTSGRTSNEAAFMYQLMVRMYGTNNLPDCSNMCHESSGVGLMETLGIGKGSVTLDDLHEAELIVVMGQNPGTNHPRMLSALEKCKKNGGTIVAVNPIMEAGLSAFIDPQSPVSILKGGTQLCDLFLQVRINGDVALLKAAMYLMLQREKEEPGSIFDHEFIKEHCNGYEEFITELAQLDYEKAVRESGLKEGKVKQLAELLCSRKKIIICWAMGLTQHKNAVDNIKEIVNVLLLRGSIGKAGSGTCPVRGHSNVQGDRTMGIWEKPPKAFTDKLGKHFDFQAPTKHGHDVVDAIKAMHTQRAKVFIAMGGNFISATPDSLYTGEAMMNCELSVQVSTKLNRSHVVTGSEALILPCLGRSEEDRQSSGVQFVSVENSMGIVHKSQGSNEPASEHLLSEPAIIAGMASELLNGDLDWNAMADNYDLVRNHIEAVIPGFEDYNKRVRKPGGFYLPNGARERRFNTDIRKAKFSCVDLPGQDLKEGHFLMMTIRTHDQYNTTIYGLDDRYRGIYNERRVVLMNPADMEEHGLKAGQVVDLKGHFKGEERMAHQFKLVPYEISRNCIATYFPEANVLVAVDDVARKSNTPVSKSVVVEVMRSRDAGLM